MTLKIKLKKEECVFLERFVKEGTRKARAVARANVLLLANKGYGSNRISGVLNVHRRRIWRVKKRYLDEGLESALEEKPRSGQPRKYTERHKAEIIALARTAPPKGRKRWTIRLMVEKLRKRKGFGTINRETVRLVLKKSKKKRN